MRGLLLAALSLGSCSKSPPASGPRWQVPLTAEAAAGDEVVATVDGRPILASQVAEQARASGTSVREALAALTTAEVLAGEAVRRGYDRDRDALLAAKQAGVRRYLHVSFEKEVVPGDIPHNVVRRFYNARRNMYDHSEYVDVWHILTPVDEKAAPEARARARATAEEVARRAKSVKGEAEFQAIAGAVPPPEGGKPLKVERIVTARDGWVLTAFSYAAFDQLAKPGDVSRVVETSYGYHVIYLIKRIPPLHQSVDDASTEIRAALFPDFQRAEFLRFADEAKKLHAVTVHPERLTGEGK
jgi:hypothetical protein